MAVGVFICICIPRQLVRHGESGVRVTALTGVMVGKV